jgi:hypothetical protein
MSKIHNEREPFFRGLSLLPFKDSNQPIHIRNLHAPDGPCELAIRTRTEMPLIDKLDEETRFTIGLATRYIVASFDGVLSLREEVALAMYGQIAEDIADWMDQNHNNVSSFTVDTYITLFLKRYGHLYDAAGFPATFFASRVHNYVNIFVPALLHGHVAHQGRNISLGALLADRSPGARSVQIQPRAYDIEAACVELLDTAPVLHVPARVYDECERADWTGFYLNSGIFRIRAFRVQVDGQTWLQSINNPLIQLQTEWLIVDIRESIWKCYERVLMRQLDSGNSGEITYGAWSDSTTSEYGPIETQTYVPIENEYQSLTCPPEEASRIFHVMASLMILMLHPDVTIPTTDDGLRAKLELPAGRSVNSLISDMLGKAS